jgi:hypothetical protein
MVWCAASLLLVFAPGRGIAAPPFPDAIQAGDVRFSLRGTASYQFLFFPLYRGALYVGVGSNPDRFPADVPMRLELRYDRSISRHQLIRAAEGNLERFLDPEALRSIRERVDRLHRWYVGVEKDDRYVLQYIPGKGTELFFNDQSLGAIPGYDFAEPYFSIWIGPEAKDRKVRDALLGKTVPGS